MTLLTMIQVVSKVEGIKVHPNQRTFHHFFGGVLLKRLENVLNVKLC